MRKSILLLLLLLGTTPSFAQTSVVWNFAVPTTAMPTPIEGYYVYRNGLKLGTIPSTTMTFPLTASLPGDVITVSSFGHAADGLLYESPRAQAPPVVSPDGTKIVAPVGTLIAADGATWTWGTNVGLPAGNYHVLRNGVDTGGGGSVLKTCSGQIDNLGDDPTPTWYQWNGTTFFNIGSVEPCATAPLPTLAVTCKNVTAMSVGSAVPVVFPLPTTTGGVAPIGVSTSPVSGSSFPVGSTTVTGTASDSAGQIARCTFTVVVSLSVPPPNQCVASPLSFTVRGWPASATGNRRFDYGSNRPVQIVLELRSTPWTATATDGLGCVVKVAK